MTAYDTLREQLSAQPRTWLVTGCAGFIGSNLLEALLRLGQTVIGLDNFSTAHQERAYTRGQLLDQVWGGNVYVEERTVDVHIRRLRKALGEAYENLVQTVRGTGYRFSTKA